MLCAQAQVQDDIASSVLRNPLRLCSSFNRPNISYHVRYQLCGSPSAVTQIADLIEEMKDSTGATPCSIIYTLKRETADEVAGRLKAKGTHETHFIMWQCHSCLFLEVMLISKSKPLRTKPLACTSSRLKSMLGRGTCGSLSCGLEGCRSSASA